jgi:hypothetical protein
MGKLSSNFDFKSVLGVLMTVQTSSVIVIVVTSSLVAATLYAAVRIARKKYLGS